MDAPTRLSAYLKARGISQSEFAREIGHHQTHVGRLLTGKRGPGLELVHAIERATATWEHGPIRTEEWLPGFEPDSDVANEPATSTKATAEDLSPAVIEATPEEIDDAAGLTGDAAA